LIAAVQSGPMAFRRLPPTDLTPTPLPTKLPELAKVDSLLEAVEQWQLRFKDLDVLSTATPPAHLVKRYIALGGWPQLRFENSGTLLFDSVMALEERILPPQLNLRR